MKLSLTLGCLLGVCSMACGDEADVVAATDFYSISCSEVTCHGASSYAGDALQVNCEWACASLYPDNEEMKNAVASMGFTRADVLSCFQVDPGISPKTLPEICNPD